MFCPNCGTKNPDSEAKCAQCGFDLQAKAPQARFKGTMVMAPTSATPKATPAGAPTPEPSLQAPPATKAGSLKGTMIGVAPPEMARALEEAKAKAASQAAARAEPARAEPPRAEPPPAEPARADAAPPATAKPSLKGTMIGVAPPDMQAAISAARAKLSAAGPAAGTGGPAAQSAPTAGSAAASAASAAAKPNIKGTMIGVAPPDVKAAIAAHKADMEKKPVDDVHAGHALTDPAPAKPSSPLARPASSKLKGTMIGVAPPDMSQAVAEAKAKATPAAPPKAPPAPAQNERAPVRATPDFGATMVGTAAPVTESLRPGPTASRSPSGEFRGTMVGATSPLVESNDSTGFESEHGPDSRAAGNSDHPAAFASTSLSAIGEIEAARANLQRVLAESEPPPKPPTGRDVPTGAQSPAALRSIAQTSKKSALPLLLLGLALVIVAALIAIALINRSKAEPEAPNAPPPTVPPAVQPR